MTDLSTTQSMDARGITAPQAGYKFYQPWYEDYTRRLGSSVFGTPGGVGGLINMPQDIPLQQTAGLTPLMMQARYGLSGASPYTPAYQTASQLMGEAAGGYRGSTAGFDPYTMISPYYDPFEDQVVEDTLSRMRKQSRQEDIAGRAQDVSSGAFGGARGRLLAKERQRSANRGIMQALSGIRSEGFRGARDAAMAENARRLAAMSGAAGGLGGIAGQVLGLGGQRQQEMMNYLQMMDQFGTAGRNIYETGLGRIQDAAMRRAQEPWDRVMRGMGILQGMKPGELIGGYETKIYQPQMYQQPTSAGSTIQGIGSLLGLGSTIADIGKTFGWWGQEPGGNAQGGFIEKPKDYNAGGIVSGIVPINMATGGDADLQNELDKLEPSVREKVANYMKENPWARKAGLAASIALLFAPIPGARLAAGARLAPGLTRGARTAWSKLRGQGREVKSKGGKWWDVDSRQGQAILNANKNAPMRVVGDPKSITMRAGKALAKRPIRTGLGLWAGLSLLGGEEEEEKILAPEATDEWLELQKEELAKAKTKKEREKIIDDIVTTTSRLGEMMNAPGTRQVTLADAANVFSEERRDLPRSEAMQAAQQMADETGMSLKDIIELTALQPGLEGRVESQEQLAQRIMNIGLSQYGANMQGHPDVQKYVAEGLSEAEAAAKVKLEIMRTLRALDYGTLKAYADQLGQEVIELNASE